jgi:hypothetical protein
MICHASILVERIPFALNFTGYVINIKIKEFQMCCK